MCGICDFNTHRPHGVGNGQPLLRHRTCRPCSIEPSIRVVPHTYWRVPDALSNRLFQAECMDKRKWGRNIGYPHVSIHIVNETAGQKTCEAKTKEIVDAITDSVMHFSRSLFFQYGKKKYVTVFVCDTTVARCDVASRARCDVTSRNDVLLTVPMDNFCYGLILSAASLSEGHYLLSPSPDSMWRPIRREELPWWPSSLGRLP